MSGADLARHGTGYEVLESEPPETLGRNLVTASHLLAGATAFFFVSFLFAFFYLRSIDQPALWKPSGVDASTGWGTAIVACWVVSVALVRLGGADQRADRRAQWRLKGLVALLLGLAGLVLQVVAWRENGFGPTDGAFASVYVGWTGFLFLFVLGALYWLETALATSWRYRNEPFGGASVPPGHASGDAGRTGVDIRNPVHLNVSEVTTLGFYWTFLVGVAVVSWVILYLVA